MKKSLTSLVLAVLMVMSLCIPAAANDKNADSSSLHNRFEHFIQETESTPAFFPKQDSSSPCAWGGPAPQITKIELDSYGALKETGNFGLILKVTGYGGDRGQAFFNGKPVEGEDVGYFINYGNSADGFYYLYDCGPMPASGTYKFTTKYRSVNAPYSTLSFSHNFTFPLQYN